MTMSEGSGSSPAEREGTRNLPRPPETLSEPGMCVYSFAFEIVLQVTNAGVRRPRNEANSVIGSTYPLPLGYL